MKTRITIRLESGDPITIEKDDYEGFHTHPTRRETVLKKVLALASPTCESNKLQKMITMIDQLEFSRIRDLTAVLRTIKDLDYGKSQSI